MLFDFTWWVRKNRKTKEFENRIEELKQEIEGSLSENNQLKLENNQLKFRDRHLSAIATDENKNDLVFKREEQDFYSQENKELLLDTLTDALINVRKNSRKHHVLSAILDNNPSNGELEERRLKIKTLFKNYTTMTPKIKKALEEMGFEFISEKNHYKIKFHNDDRYVVIIAKTPSDVRFGKNTASDICKLLF